MRLFVSANQHDRALFVQLHAALAQADTLAALELIGVQSSYFFPPETDGPYTIHLYATCTRNRGFGLATTRRGLMMTDLYTWRYFGVPAVEESLFDKNDGSSGPAASPSGAALAAVAAFQSAFEPRIRRAPARRRAPPVHRSAPATDDRRRANGVDELQVACSGDGRGSHPHA